MWATQMQVGTMGRDYERTNRLAPCVRREPCISVEKRQRRARMGAASSGYAQLEREGVLGAWPLTVFEQASSSRITVFTPLPSHSQV